MTIKSRLQLIILVTALVFSSLVGVNVWWQRQFGTLNDQLALVTGLNHTLFQRAQIRDEYFMYRDDRAIEQWSLLTRKLDEFLQRLPSTLPSTEEDGVAHGMLTAQKRIGKLFAMLLETDKSDAPDTPESVGLRQRIIIQMMSDAHDMYVDGMLLSTVMNAKMTRYHRLSMVIGSSSLLLLGLMIVGMTVLIMRSITKPIEKFLKGVEIAAQGNLNHKIGLSTGDELGRLSDAFDDMTARLKHITVSRDELSEEIVMRKQAEEEVRQQREELLSIYENAPIVLLLVDAEKRILKINDLGDLSPGRLAAEMVGLRVGEALRCLYALDDPRGCGFGPRCESCRVRRAIENAFKTGTDDHNVEVALPFEVADEVAERHFLQSTSRITVKERTMVLVSLMDITRQKRAEEQVRTINADLERRVHERTSELEAVNRELETFSYSVSHDLRAPLRAIEGFSGMVIEDYGGKLDAEGQRLLGVVRANAEKMSRLIDDLLAFSRTGRDEMKHGRLDMAEMARSVFEEVSGDTAARARIDFTVGELPEAEGDAALVRQVWVNLLSNAVKYSSRKERAVIEVSGTLEGNQSEYRVRDNGAGFDMQYAGKLFGVFQRLHAANEFEGTGIGLALAQRIVARHGGRVWAAAEVGKGATFFFTLPTSTKG